MFARELKEILANVKDDAVVIICNPQWKTTEIIGHQVVENNAIYDGRDTLYLDIKNFKR